MPNPLTPPRATERAPMPNWEKTTKQSRTKYRAWMNCDGSVASANPGELRHDFDRACLVLSISDPIEAHAVHAAAEREAGAANLNFITGEPLTPSNRPDMDGLDPRECTASDAPATPSIVEQLGAPWKWREYGNILGGIEDAKGETLGVFNISVKGEALFAIAAVNACAQAGLDLATLQDPSLIPFLENAVRIHSGFRGSDASVRARYGHPDLAAEQGGESETDRATGLVG